MNGENSAEAIVQEWTPPKVSFVLPTHNRIEWLPLAIQSLMTQTEKNIEIVIINDGSTDGTKEFLDEWAPRDNRIMVYHNEKALGAGRSRNLGVAVATSELIAVCDDDDVYINTRAAQIVRWFNENPKSELVTFPYVSVDYFDQIVEAFHGRPFDHEAFEETGEVSYYCNPAAAFRRSSFEQTKGYGEESEGLTDDYQFLTNWIAAGKKVDFCGNLDGQVPFATMHRILPDSMMAKIRGFDPAWLKARA